MVQKINYRIKRQIGTKILLPICVLSVLLTSCKKLIEVNTPTTSISGENVFTNDGTAISLLTGIYTQISSGSLLYGDFISVGLLTGLSGDELTLDIGSKGQPLNDFYINKLTSNTGNNLWYNIYPKIFVVNSAIEKLPNATSLTAGVKRQLLGEAKFMRAFFYFYLVNLYGDIPLVLSTDYTVNSVRPRTPKAEVWSQIIADLKDAKELLTTDYLDATLLGISPERVRPNKWAATALLARSYLYTQDWINAEAQATEVINHTALFHLDSLNNVFQKNNPEAIWQLQPVNYGSNTEDAKTYIIHSDGFSLSKPVYLSENLVNSFEINDQRKISWTNTITISGNSYAFPSKYKSDSLNAPLTEYNTVLRLAEQFLIRSEAKAEQKNIQGSLDDLNTIRKRAWLKKYEIGTSLDLSKIIYQERRVELFNEWGHRWLDLKRSKTVNSVMGIVTPQKGGTWSPNWQLYPIPPSDILANKNIIQNPGY